MLGEAFLFFSSLGHKLDSTHVDIYLRKSISDARSSNELRGLKVSAQGSNFRIVTFGELSYRKDVK